MSDDVDETEDVVFRGPDGLAVEENDELTVETTDDLVVEVFV